LSREQATFVAIYTIVNLE